MSRNPTDLHPAHPDDAAREVLGVVDPERVIARAEELATDEQYRLALHVIDLVALAPGDDLAVRRARGLKAAWCDRLGRSDVPFVSRSLYRSGGALLETGRRRWSETNGGGLHSLSNDNQDSA